MFLMKEYQESRGKELQRCVLGEQDFLEERRKVGGKGWRGKAGQPCDAALGPCRWQLCRVRPAVPF